MSPHKGIAWTAPLIIIALLAVVIVGYISMRKAPVGDMPMGGIPEADTSISTDGNGRYEDYAPGKLAYAAEGDVVLFFHASWCPTCRATEAAIGESGIPDGLTILKVNYDTAIELRQRYGVTVQHTFVHVDEDGNEIAKWQGTITPAEIASRAQ
jgi:thiol-disulfide isomerase/thioredoxin